MVMPGHDRHGLALLLLLSSAVLAGCAETRYVMTYGVEEATAETLPRWPLPPEIPRFLYAGELTGEQNYVAVEMVQQSRFEKALAWIVGLALPPAKPRRLQRPVSVMVDGGGRILVSDVGWGAVFVFDEPEGKLYIWEQASPFVQFQSPVGIAIGPGGVVFVADAELGEVVRLSADGEPLGSFGKTVLERPTGLAWNPDQELLYVADTHAHDIKAFDSHGSLIEIIGARGEKPGEFNFPTHLAYANGMLYVTDTMNARVQMIDTSGTTVRVFGERGVQVGSLARPKGIAVDDEGDIYVIESYFDHLLVFNSVGRFLLPIGGEGFAPGQFRLPSGVHVDGRNRVFVADTFNGRVSIFQFLGGVL